MPPKQRSARLALWQFEDELKGVYEAFVRFVGAHLLHDPLDTTRVHACQVLADLLTARPEQEQFLLCTLANKLGDSCVRVCTRVVTLLLRAVAAHPGFRAALVDQCEALVFRWAGQSD